MLPRLPNVYWIGGPPDSGKSTVAGLLGEWFEIEIYRQDQREMEHITRADPVLHPRHVAMRRQIEQRDGQKSFFQVWVDRAPKVLLDDARSNWEERISLVCEDLAALDPTRPVIAEGPGFFPNVIAPLMTSRQHAMWLVPTKAFKRESHERRSKSAWRFETSDPERALANHIERDLLFADAYRRELMSADLPWIEVDGSESAEVIARRVADHFDLS
jgi:hypothetical protein